MTSESFEELVWITAQDISQALRLPIGDCLISAISQTSRGLPISPDEMVRLAKSVRNRAFRKYKRKRNVDQYITWCDRHMGIPDDLI